MAVFQRSAGVQNNIHLDNQLVARVVGLQALDLPDGLGESHGQVKHCELSADCTDASYMQHLGAKRTNISLVGSGRKAGEMPDMFKGGLGPVEDDDQGEDQTTEGIKPPYSGIVSDWRQQTLVRDALVNCSQDVLETNL